VKKPSKILNYYIAYYFATSNHLNNYILLKEFNFASCEGNNKAYHIVINFESDYHSP